MKIRRSIKRSLLDPQEDEEEDGPLLSTGCTLLNLALSDKPNGGFMKGKYYYLVGDSTSGKTFFSMTCFAEACVNPEFEDYRLIYDNVEDGMLMDVQRLFGPHVARYIEAPGDGDSYSETIEEFYYHLDDAIKDGRPFIYVLDSMDGLDAKADQSKFDEQKKAHRKGKATAGSYGMEKAKKNSTMLRRVVANLRKTGSILIVISQTRDNTGFGYKKKTRSGGRSLKFYATVEIWTSVGGKIKKSVRGRSRAVGTKVKIHLEKNRITGKLHDNIWTAIYPSYGIDDTGSNIDYLVAERWWKKAGKVKIKAREFSTVATRVKLISWIESKPARVLKLQRIVAKCWNEIQAACALDRKGRYQ